MRIVITGGSRGVGAACAALLAAEGHDVAIGYRRAKRRAGRVLSTALRSAPGSFLVRADLAGADGADEFVQQVRHRWTGADALILCAAGGLEADSTPARAEQLNRHSVLRLTHGLLSGGHAVYVTSHPAHFYGRFNCPTGYDLVARTKRDGELALRAAAAERRFGLSVVTADLLADSHAARLLEFDNPGLIADRTAANGRRLSTGELAEVVCAQIAAGAADPATTVVLGRGPVPGHDVSLSTGGIHHDHF
jgi:3-oxoacyl-[acyl-carrier protein] reductase